MTYSFFLGFLPAPASFPLTLFSRNTEPSAVSGMSDNVLSLFSKPLHVVIPLLAVASFYLCRVDSFLPFMSHLSTASSGKAPMTTLSPRLHQVPLLAILTPLLPLCSIYYAVFVAEAESCPPW